MRPISLSVVITITVLISMSIPVQWQCYRDTGRDGDVGRPCIRSVAKCINTLIDSSVYVLRALYTSTFGSAGSERLSVDGCPTTASARPSLTSNYVYWELFDSRITH
ncbi:hypothetical protein EVAR_917_1 [Eumeta japonica]|uniref:Uncharacterized protein n=1 Tax=Eumeta variegata TaxID=151549 RepID=A0A4C1SGT9_EUMVA|nr:hypothetical protein EVAR_917_1 [Eumeta japonica]